jgi:hypothetical protein
MTNHGSVLVLAIAVLPLVLLTRPPGASGQAGSGRAGRLIAADVAKPWLSSHNPPVCDPNEGLG